MASSNTIISSLLKQHEQELLESWIKEIGQGNQRSGRMRESEIREECREFLTLFSAAITRSEGTTTDTPAWEALRSMLRSLTESRTQKGFSPTEIATFVFSLKKPLFNEIRKLSDKGIAQAGVDEIWAVTLLLDQLGMYTAEVFQKVREGIISRQQQDMLELSTPVVKLWDGILALPMIGTLDSSRTQAIAFGPSFGGT